MLTVEHLDHLVLTVSDVDCAARWYRDVLGMQIETFGEGRTAVTFGQQKINLHPANAPVAPHATHPLPGSADLCFLTSTPLDAVAAFLASAGVSIEEGPVARTGAIGPLLSVYVRDLDGNLIEIANRNGGERV